MNLLDTCFIPMINDFGSKFRKFLQNVEEP